MRKYHRDPHPTVMFADNRDMRTTSKSVLKNKLQILSDEWSAEPPVVITVDDCALLWTVSWPATLCKNVCIYHSCGSQDLEKDGHHASATCGVWPVQQDDH